MSEEDRERILRIEIPSCILSKGSEEPAWTTIDGMNGWNPTTIDPLALYWKGTIDLSGYARDYKTFYPQGGVIQQGPYQTEDGGGGTLVYYIVSSIPLDVDTTYAQLIQALAGPGLINQSFVGALGFNQSQDWNTVMFAESQLMFNNLNISPNPFGVQQVVERNQTGSVSPTAADTLYCMKLVIPFATTQTTIGIPASRIILPGSMDQEPELEYMMRLSRSLQLANQV
jgi:hypothetical protein